MGVQDPFKTPLFALRAPAACRLTESRPYLVGDLQSISGEHVRLCWAVQSGYQKDAEGRLGKAKPGQEEKRSQATKSDPSTNQPNHSTSMTRTVCNYRIQQRFESVLRPCQGPPVLGTAVHVVRDPSTAYKPERWAENYRACCQLSLKALTGLHAARRKWV